MRDRAPGAPTPADKRANVDRRLRELLQTNAVPTKPGAYLDSTGDRGRLDAEVGWTDHQGVWRDARYAPITALFIDRSGPMTRVNRPAADA
ncbi:hypothetical protein [Streptomyces sp. MMS24-I29]|uniref:hypothetical protein n=1 Tax=Streptomyces sp. MMS24-I29 TaxID=3351480 RepID=UPI003C7CAB53